jgi:hypothetical protein
MLDNCHVGIVVLDNCRQARWSFWTSPARWISGYNGFPGTMDFRVRWISGYDGFLSTMDFRVRWTSKSVELHPIFLQVDFQNNRTRGVTM